MSQTNVRYSATVPAILPDKSTGEFTIPIVDLREFTLDQNAKPKEEAYRQAIAALPEESLLRRVLSDLYRQLVIGNFDYVDQMSGHDATGHLDMLYPDNGTLPSFVRQNKANRSGMILYNVLLATKRLDGAEAVGYRVLGAILARLLDEGFYSTPKLIDVP